MHNPLPRILLALSLLLALAVGTYFLWPREAPNDGPPIAEPTAPQVDPEDTDNDGLKDTYELTFFHTLEESADEDADGLPDKLELRYYDDLAATADEDGDGLPDAWELQHFGSLRNGPEDNPDGDEFTNIQELLRGRSYSPNRKTVIKSAEDAQLTVSVSGRSTIAGTGKRGPDGKVYFKNTYNRLVHEGKFTTRWDEL